MKKLVDLILLGNYKSGLQWSLGHMWSVQPTPSAINGLVHKQAESSDAEAWLFWDGRLGVPNADKVQQALNRPGDLWHAGLRLGMGGLPGLIDFIHPTWMLNRDPDPNIEATSWRLSLRACLVRTEVLRQMGGVHPTFATLEGAALEMGHRYITRGVLMRHVPWLIPGNFSSALSASSAVNSGAERGFASPLPFEDELRFVYYRFGPFWTRWALFRAIMIGYISPAKALKCWWKVRREQRPPDLEPYHHPIVTEDSPLEKLNVSVLIPTLDRYSYLRTLLHQLRQQAVQPSEILVIDQTSQEQRDERLFEEFRDLPLRAIFRSHPGQCSSRNAGLQVAKGDWILFIDDDDEIPPTLIEDHLSNLNRFRAQVSSGVADEVGAEPLPEAFTLTRASDVFPTNNTMICKDALIRSGLFDLAYERGQRADGDLGMRVYLSGALMVLNPEIRVLHHRAPRGGLRTHGARVITYSSSRQKLTHRHLPSATEVYLAKRYFTPRQVREMLWLRALGTFSIRGGWFKKLLKLMVSLFCLPDTLWQIRKACHEAERMLEKFPQIPRLEDAPRRTLSSPRHFMDHRER